MFEELILFLVVVTFDPAPPIQHSFFDLQAAAMGHVVGIEQRKYKEGSLNPSTSSAVENRTNFVEVRGDTRTICDWPGVKCSNKHIVRTIEWTTSQVPRINLQYIFLQWMPNTVRHLLIKSQRPARKDRFEARCLPRESLHIEITQCGFEGNLVIESLPVGLHTVDLTANALCGTVSLVNLPPCLHTMILVWNPLNRIIVDNEALPESLIIVKLMSERKIQKAEVKGRKVDSRIVVKFYNTKYGSERRI